MTPYLLAAVLLGICVEPPVPGTEKAPPAVQVQPPEDLSTLTMDELIARLPPTGGECLWDAEFQSRVVNPATTEMTRRMRTATLTDEQWQTVLISTGALRMRHKWPADFPYMVSATVPFWLEVSQIRLRPRLDGMRSFDAGELFTSTSATGPMMHYAEARQGQPLGTVPLGTTSIVFDVEVERGRSSVPGVDSRERDEPKPALLWQGTIQTPVELVTGFEEAAPGVSNPELDRAVRHAIGAGVRSWVNGREHCPYLVVDPDGVAFPSLLTTGLDLQVEIVKDGAVLARSSLVAHDTDWFILTWSWSRAQHRFYGSTYLDLDANPDDTAGWIIRLTGKADHLWCLWEARQWWNGTTEIPWAQAVAHEQERAVPIGRIVEMSAPHLR